MPNSSDLIKQAKRERLRVIVNPEVLPDAVWGDIGAILPPLDNLDRDIGHWTWRLLKVSLGIIAIFALVIVVMALALWYLGALGFR